MVGSCFFVTLFATFGQYLHKMFKKIGNFLLDAVFPTYCCGCGKFGDYLCEECVEKLHFFTLPIKLNLFPQYLDELTAAVDYAPPISQLIYTLKYHGVMGIGEYCGQLLYDSADFPSTEVVTAVPLHPKRRAQRGYNQAEIIAKKVSQLSGTPYYPLLKRKDNTTPQALLTDREKRLTHLRHAFLFIAQKIPASVLLIDDVSTTGTTLNECAKVLKENGVQKVFALTVAHGN